MSKVGVFIVLLVVLVSGIFVIHKSIVNTICANTKSCKESLVEKIENNSEGTFDGQKIEAPNVNLADDEAAKKVLGESTATGEKHIYVDLDNQTLTAYQGDTLILQTLISSGKWFPTPTGDFKIWRQVRATRMSGGEGADAYDLPNVPFVMFFYNNEIAKGRGFGLHGAYWHNNFGHPMSHGCINMRTIDAEKLYYWADSDTIITIYGKAP